MPVFSCLAKRDHRNDVWLHTMLLQKEQRILVILDVDVDGCVQQWCEEGRFNSRAIGSPSIVAVNTDPTVCKRMERYAVDNHLTGVTVVCGDIHEYLRTVEPYSIGAIWLDYMKTAVNISPENIRCAFDALVTGGYLAVTASQRAKNARIKLEQLVSPFLTTHGVSISYRSACGTPMCYMAGSSAMKQAASSPTLRSTIDDCSSKEILQEHHTSPRDCTQGARDMSACMPHKLDCSNRFRDDDDDDDSVLMFAPNISRTGALACRSTTLRQYERRRSQIARPQRGEAWACYRCQTVNRGETCTGRNCSALRVEEGICLH